MLNASQEKSCSWSRKRATGFLQRQGSSLYHTGLSLQTKGSVKAQHQHTAAAYRAQTRGLTAAASLPIAAVQGPDDQTIMFFFFFFFPFSPKPQHPFVSKAMPPPFVSPEFGAMFLVCELVGSRSAFLPWLFSSVMIILVSDIIKKT